MSNIVSLTAYRLKRARQRLEGTLRAAGVPLTARQVLAMVIIGGVIIALASKSKRYER